MTSFFLAHQKLSTSEVYLSPKSTFYIFNYKIISAFNNNSYLPLITAKLINSFKPNFNPKLILLVAFFLGLFSGASCQQTKDTKVKARKNIVVLLDLSDRILANDQVSEDLTLLNALLEEFYAQAKDQMFVSACNRIHIRVVQEDGLPINWAEYDHFFHLDMAEVPIQDKQKVAKAMLESWPRKLRQLYREACFSKNPQDYKGAKLWRAFHEDLPLELSKSAQIGKITYLNTNKLIVLTDGYFDFEDYTRERTDKNTKTTHTKFVSALAAKGSAWEELMLEKQYGLVSIAKANFASTQLLVLGVKPHGHYHSEILKKVWSNWLADTPIKLQYFLPANNLHTSRSRLIEHIR